MKMSVGVGEVRGDSPGNDRLTHVTAYEENININFIRKFSAYRAVNTLSLCYTNQSVNVVWGNKRCLF